MEKEEIKGIIDDLSTGDLGELMGLMYERVSSVIENESERLEFDKERKEVEKDKQEVYKKMKDLLIEFVYNLTDEELLEAFEYIDAMVKSRWKKRKKNKKMNFRA